MNSKMNSLIKKKILNPGDFYKPVTDGTKVHFNFQTRKVDFNNTLIDDSKKIGKKEPIALVFGKKFKIEAWETMLKTMAVNEVAKFTVDKSLVAQYPFISRAIRDADKDSSERNNHVCAMSLHNNGLGYDDLNELLAYPCDLEFIFELFKVENPDEYEKDLFFLTDHERFDHIPKLKEKGNRLFKEKLYSEAAERYSEAICFCEQLMCKEQPEGEEWNALNKMKIPILLNYCQCKLFEGDYYSVIEHCTTVLKFEPENTKALFRRGNAYISAWNPSGAIDDFNKVKKLDESLTKIIDKKLKEIETLQKERNKEDTKNLKNLFG